MYMSMFHVYFPLLGAAFLIICRRRTEHSQQHSIDARHRSNLKFNIADAFHKYTKNMTTSEPNIY